MNRYVLCGLCLIHMTLNGAEIPPLASSLSSEEAHYDGSTLELKGHVVLDHEIGQMRAEEALLARQETGSSFPFASIGLRKEVHLALKENAAVLCERADLDFTTLKGTLSARNGESVLYRDILSRKKGSEATSLELKSSKLQLDFSKQEIEGEKTRYDVQSIFASENVLIDYAGEFQCMAHEALYRKQSVNQLKSNRKEFQGVITAYPRDEHSPCKLIHLGSEILADMIDLDLAHEKMTLLHPRGAIHTHPGQEALHFQADYLYWDRLKQLLEFKGHITIDDPTFGHLATEETLWIAHQKVSNSFELKSLKTQGLATLTYRDSQGRSHTLITPGPILLDQEALKGTIDAPARTHLFSEEHKQLCYKTDTVTIYADKGSIDYAWDAKKLVPSLITLSGSVRLISLDTDGNKRLAASDRLSYAFDTQSLILSANPGKKVLFFDGTTGARLSAPEVHVTRDPITQQEEFKGIGAVQFTFTPDEESKLHRLFPDRGP